MARRGPSPNALRRATGAGGCAGLCAIGFVAAYGHVVYPAWLALVTRRRPAAPAPVPVHWPAISVVVPAYREAGLIADKVADVRGDGYPGALEVVVVADDPETAEAARATGARLVAAPDRLGKAEALNRGVRASSHDVIVMTDANTRLVPGSLARLVRWFEDPAIGAVAGEKQVVGGGQGAYWAYESFLKRRESIAGTAFGLVGELGAIRRGAYRPLPGDLVVDDLWIALDVVAGGARIHYEPEAVALEHPSVSFADEWERRTRVVCGVLDVLARRRSMLAPGRSPVAGALWGHRLVRSSAGPLAHVLLLGRALRAARRRGPARWFLGGHVLGAAAIAGQARGADLPAPLRLLAQVLLLQGVALGGMRRYVAHDRPARWPKAERTGFVGAEAVAQRPAA